MSDTFIQACVTEEPLRRDLFDVAQRQELQFKHFNFRINNPIYVMNHNRTENTGIMQRQEHGGPPKACLCVCYSSSLTHSESAPVNPCKRWLLGQGVQCLH